MEKAVKQTIDNSADPDGAAVLQPGVVLPVRRALALPLAQEDEEAHHRHHQQRHGQ